jgi:Icc-related predicted phosphoesterase
LGAAAGAVSRAIADLIREPQVKLLALSDIHHNLMAVEALRAKEGNSFDAVVVGGDIGNESAQRFFEILSTFRCPTLYVYGNWDHKLSYKRSFGSNCHLVHGNVFQIDTFSFTGFSGCPTNWGMNPIFRRLTRQIETENADVVAALSQGGTSAERTKRTKAYRKYVMQRQLAKTEVLRLNRLGISRAIRKNRADPNRSIVITHERVAGLSQQLPGTLLHIFGHIHKYSDRSFRGTRYIDVAALDRPSPGVGNYAIIEIDSALDIKAKCVPLTR